MIHTNFPRFVFLTIVMTVGCTLYSQNSKEAVILLNTKPVFAQITMDGSVLKVIRDEPDYLEGFILQVPDYVKFLEELNKSKSEKSVTDLNLKSNVINDELITVPFESGFAVLTDKAIVQLDNAIKLLKTNPEGKLILRTLSISNATILDQNRINSIKSYFKIRGIKPELILYEAMRGNTNLNEVKISLTH